MVMLMTFHNKQKTTLAVITAAIIVAVGTFVLVLEFDNSVNNQSVVPSVIADAKTDVEGALMFVDWVGFTDVKNMTATATDIVVASVDRTKESIGVDYPLTYYELSIKESWKGNLKSGNIIELREFGGIYSHQNQIVDGVMVEENKEYIFFLQPNPKQNNYVPIGGPNGKFIIENNKVYSLDHVNEKAVANLSVLVKDVSFVDFKNEITDYVFQEELAKAEVEGEQ